ncbi:hypothetical protein F018LOC_04309 [Pectobacterium versatile]|nr:hypothetical protein F018LOC_04309 [Pectobacterium versatile]
MMSFTEVSIDSANMKSNDEVKTRHMPEKSQKKALHHGGQKDRDGVYGKEKQGVYLLHITTRTALHFLQTTLALLLGILCLGMACRAWCWSGHLVKHGYLLLHLFHALLMLQL